MTLLELVGTKEPVKKDKQVKFYVPSSLMKACEVIFDQQGVDLSEGMTRLVRVLVEAPAEAIPIILNQAPGGAAVTLAEDVLRRARVSEDEVEEMDEETGERMVAVGKVSLPKGSGAGGPAKRGKQRAR